ncbi:hypothetical protein RFI_24718 [Reticulomyxa filosa]|uniref:CRAL-TRIO domain-containing protein n=1 Tax=Reticulomyxa filosa TaxID=46433 RepID=X6MHW1_RETFI|nr:hypothetical protein RFI_24718 [Reticulomyxa filosa]|eukprot:ETO12655.1 hypothetical protein RFI_24718 [Reticulomyxa filosa]
MFSRAWSYLGYDNQDKDTTSAGDSNSKPAEDSKERMEETSTNLLDGILPHHSTTATTSEHPYPMLHAHGNHVYSLSTPLLNKLTDETSSEVTDEKVKEFKQSMHSTFNPIQHHYVSISKNLGHNDVAPHSAPIALSFTDTLQTENSTKVSPRQSQKGFQSKKKKKTIDSTKLTMIEEENNEDNKNKGNSTNSAVGTTGNKNAVVIRYFDSLSLTTHERKELEELHEWIGRDTLSNKMKDELCLGDMILSCYSSYSKNNPDAKGCWKRWISYRDDSPLKDVNFRRVREFFDTGLFNVAYDKESRPVFIINTKHYDDSFGPEITAKATILFITSLLWNVRQNSFDFDALRKGICVYADLSHYSINMLAWNVIQACKSALIAFPFQLIDIYCVNTPTFVYMLRQIAAKVKPQKNFQQF